MRKQVRRNRRDSLRRGFTLIESMIALVVLLVGSAGAIAALLAASRELTTGQVRQYEMVLVDAAFQRLRLSDKQVLFNEAIAAPTTSPHLESTPNIGASPWVPDPSTAPATDPLGVGAYFRILPDGKIAPAADVPAGTACGDEEIPADVFCREVVFHRGGPPVASASGAYANLNGANAFTAWVRISRRADPFGNAVVFREVFAQ